MITLQGPEGDKAIKLGIENPNKYILKPEREGGGKLKFSFYIKC